jgi:integrase
MGLYKRGSVWWMSFTYQGKQIKKTTGTNDKKLALRIFDKVKGEVAERKWFEKLPGEDLTFKEMMERYMTEHSARNKAPRSHVRDKSLRDHLVGHFGEMTLAEITPSQISEYKTKRREEGASPRTLNYELALMSHTFNIAIKDWEWVRENPVKKVSREKVNNQIERWLTLEEQKNLLDKSSKWLQEIILFAVNTGLRQSEILDLKWPQVDLNRKTITILEQKNQGRDTLPLNEGGSKILKERSRIRQPETDHVFYNGNGKKVDGGVLRRGFNLAVKKTGLKHLRFHDLRHTFATRLIQAGVDLYTVQKLGRWKNISMVMRYAHHYPESLRSGVEVLDTINKKIRTKLGQSKKQGLELSS